MPAGSWSKTEGGEKKIKRRKKEKKMEWYKRSPGYRVFMLLRVHKKNAKDFTV